MEKIEISLKRGSFFRVILGMLATAFFIINAFVGSTDQTTAFFLIAMGAVLTWQQYSLYLMKKNGDLDDE